MKHLYLFIFITILLVAASQQNNAMENTFPISKAKVLATFADVKKPHSVIYFHGDTIAIAGEYICNLYSFSTKQKIKELYYKPTTYPFYIHHPYITAHLNKKQLALYDETNLIIYDIATMNKTWENNSLSSYTRPKFNSTNDTIVIGHQNGINVLNYKDNSCKSHALQMTSYPIKMEFHPTQQEFILIENDDATITFLQLDKKAFYQKNF